MFFKIYDYCKHDIYDLKFKILKLF